MEHRSVGLVLRWVRSSVSGGLAVDIVWPIWYGIGGWHTAAL